VADLPACANPCRATGGGAGDSACFLVNGYPKGEGANNNLAETGCKAAQPPPDGSGRPAKHVGSPSESGRCLTQRRNATSWGWIVSDKIVEMTIGKLSHEICRSLVNNDNREISDKTRSERRAGNGFPFKVGSELHNPIHLPNPFPTRPGRHARLEKFPDLLDHPVSAESLTEADLGRISPLTTTPRSRNVLTIFSSS